MPDELYIGTKVDTSGLASGMSQAQAIVAASLDELKANYKAAQDAVKTATANMAQAEQQFAVLVQNGNQQAIAAVKQYEAELKQAQVAEQQALGAVQQYNAGLAEEAVVATEAAQAQNALAAATGHSVSEITAASAAIRTLESASGGSVRAAERFLVTTLQLGPVLQAAFPVFGAISLVEVIEKMAEKAIDLAHSFSALYQAQQAYLELSKQLDKEFQNEVNHAAQLTAEYNKLAHGPIFEFREQLDNARLSAAAHGREIEELTSKLAGLQERINRGTIVNTRAGRVVGTTDDAQAAAVQAEGVRKQIENAQLAQQNDEKQAQVALAEIRKQETEDAKKSLAEKLRTLRESDAEQLAELRANAAMQGVTGQALLNQERTFLQQRLAAESQYADRVRELRIELDRNAVQSANEFARGQSIALRSLEELNRQTESEQNRHAGSMLEAVRKQLTEQNKLLEEENRAGIERLRGAEEYAVGELKIEEARIKQRAELHQITAIQELRQLADLHQQELAQELDFWERMARIYAVGGAATAKEYEAAMNRIAQIQRQAHVTQINDETAMLKEREKNIRNFIHTVDAQFFGHINEWIRGEISFAEAMKRSWNDLVMDVIIEIEKMIAKQIEEKLVMEALKLLGLDTGSQAAKAATEAAANMALAQSNVAEASTDALLKTIAAVANPFIGVPLGIAMGEAVKTAGQSMITVPAFAKGGIVPDTTLALLHPNEMVLPPTLSTFIQNSATASTSSARMNYAPVIHAGSNMSPQQFKTMLNQHSEDVGRIMRQQVKTFNRGAA